MVMWYFITKMTPLLLTVVTTVSNLIMMIFINYVIIKVAAMVLPDAIMITMSFMKTILVFSSLR